MPLKGIVSEEIDSEIRSRGGDVLLTILYVLSKLLISVIRYTEVSYNIGIRTQQPTI